MSEVLLAPPDEEVDQGEIAVASEIESMDYAISSTSSLLKFLTSTREVLASGDRSVVESLQKKREFDRETRRLLSRVLKSVLEIENSGNSRSCS